MTEPSGRLVALVGTFGVTIIPTRRRRQPGETHGRGALEGILRDHGEEHLLLTLRCIRGSRLNEDALSSDTISAVSDVLAQRLDWQERPDELVAVFDRIDLEALRARAVLRRPWPVRATLRAWLYLVLAYRMDRSNSAAMMIEKAA